MEITKRAVAHMEKETGKGFGSLLRQIILGGQDGIVNTLGLILGVAAATNSTKLIIVAGLAATMAESMSMAAVAYTSSKAEKEYYQSELEREKWEIKHLPEIETEEIRIIYYKKGFRGKQLNDIVKRITSDKKLWLDTMMNEELRLSESKDKKPMREGVIVGVSSVAGSLVPLLPFFFFSVSMAAPASLLVSMAVLFLVGVIKSKLTVGRWIKSGAEMAAIGTISALLGYLVGVLLGGA